MTRAITALADRLLEVVLPRTSAAAVCQPTCDNTPMCCRLTQTRFHWRTCNSSCECWWGGEC